MRITAIKPTTMLNIVQILSHAMQYKTHSPKKTTRLDMKIKSIILDLLLKSGIRAFQRKDENASFRLTAFNGHCTSMRLHDFLND